MTDRPRHLVLIVDDDQAVRDALQFALRLAGLDVHAHAEGAALLADPDLERAGCLILDERNPSMDGFELLRRLRARQLGVPAILLSSHTTAGLSARADAAGVRMMLEKPLLDDALFDGLRAILGDEAFRPRWQDPRES